MTIGNITIPIPTLQQIFFLGFATLAVLGSVLMITSICRDKRCGVSTFTDSATRGSENLPTSAHSRTGNPIRSSSWPSAKLSMGSKRPRPSTARGRAGLACSSLHLSWEAAPL